MKKVFSLLMLLCMVCTGAWAQFSFTTWDGDASWPKFTIYGGGNATHYTSVDIAPICIQEENVTLGEGTLTVNFAYSSGNWGLSIAGIDLVQGGVVVAHDYHRGFTGTGTNVTYTIENVAAGTYTFRYWVPKMQEKSGADLTTTSVSANGNITYKLNDVAQDQFTNKTWNTSTTFDNPADITVPKGVWDVLRTECMGNGSWAANALGSQNKDFTMAGGVRLHDEEVTLHGGDTYYINYVYYDGSHALNLKGVELLDANGKLVGYDYHDGYSGNNNSLSTWKITVPGEADATYILRAISSNQGEISTKGQIYYYKNDELKDKISALCAQITAGKVIGTPKTTTITQIAGGSSVTDITTINNDFEANYQHAGWAYFHKTFFDSNVVTPEEGKVYTIQGAFSNGTTKYLTFADDQQLIGINAEASYDYSYWMYKDGKFQTLRPSGVYLASGSGITYNTTGTAFTYRLGLTSGSTAIKNGRVFYAMGNTGSLGQYTGSYDRQDRRINDADSWTTDFIIAELPAEKYFVYVNHMPFTMTQPLVATNVADGRGTLALYTGNDNTGTDAPIAVDRENYGSYSHGTWPNTATGNEETVFTEWAKYTSAKGNTYIYNVKNARFLAVSTGNVSGAHPVVFNDVPSAMEIERDAEQDGYYMIKSVSENKYLALTPGHGQNSGYYAVWNNDQAKVCRLQFGSTGNDVPADVRAVVEKEVELLELEAGNYVGNISAEAKAAATASIASKIDETVKTVAERATAVGSVDIESSLKTLSEDKIYVFEHAKAGKSNFVMYANKNNHEFDTQIMRWATETAVNGSTNGQKIRKYFRVKATGEQTEGQDSYYIYSCATGNGKGFVSNCSWDTAPVFCNTTDTGYGKDKIGKYIFVKRAGSNNIFNIRAQYPTSGSANDWCTLSVKANNNGDFSGEGEILSWNNLGDDYNNIWRIREVEESEVPTPTVNVAISSARVATYYFADDVVVPEGITVKTLTSEAEPTLVDDGIYRITYNTIASQQGEVIPAGTAVLLFDDKELEGSHTYGFVCNNGTVPTNCVETSAASSENLLFGTIHNNTTVVNGGEEGSIYALGNRDDRVAFYHYAGATYSSNKAYMDASTLGLGQSAVRGFYIFDPENGTITSIENIGQSEQIREAYDLQGRRLAAPIKGLNIVNGHKVMR